MRTIGRIVICLSLFAAIAISNVGAVFAQYEPGDEAPHFVLEDVYGRMHKLSSMEDNSLIILYFFDTESSSSQEGLLSLNKLLNQFPAADLLVWGITKSTKNKVSDFIVEHDAGFPVMIDNKDVSAKYDAEFILPTIYILGPELKIIDYFQGVGQTTEKMLLALAERELQRDEAPVALALAKEIQEKNPDNFEAKTLYGYAALKADRKEEAEDVFMDLAGQSGEAKISGMEGLVKMNFEKGNPTQALEIAEAVEEQAPERGYVNVLKGDYLYSQNKEEAATEEYEKAVAKSDGISFQKAYAHNQYGRLQANLGNYDQARIHYDQAIDFDPHNLVAMSNKGVTYQKEGDLEQALAAFQNAMKVNKNDTYSEILARKTQELINLKKNIAEKERVDRLVKELADRFRKQSKPFSFFNKEDRWTSRPMIVTFIDFQEKGGLAARDGISSVMTAQLTEMLNQTGRVQVVERIIMDRLLEELNLGTSDLADPNTALKLGRILAAKIVATGSLLHLADSSLLSLRLIDSETTAIPKVLTRKLAPGAMNLDEEIQYLNRQILQTVVTKYPLKGFIVQAEGDGAIINLGSNQGVVLGTLFEVLEEGKAIKYKGKVMKGLPAQIGKIEVVRVEPDMCSVRIVEQNRPLQTDDKIQEVAGVFAGTESG